MQTAAGEENQEPSTTRPAVSTLPDPPTDKKPPTGPASIRPASSLEKNTARPVVHSHPVQAKPVPEPEPDKTIMTPAPDALWSSTKVETVSASPALQRNKEDLKEAPTLSAPTLSAPGMKSRLQRLAEQRQYWDNEGRCFVFVCVCVFIHLVLVNLLCVLNMIMGFGSSCRNCQLFRV